MAFNINGRRQCLAISNFHHYKTDIRCVVVIFTICENVCYMCIADPNGTCANSGPSTPRPPRSAEKRRRQYVEAKKHLPESRAMEKFMTRDFKAGDIYAPHDLSPAEMRKWRVRKSPATDAFDALHLNPLELYKVGRTPSA